MKMVDEQQPLEGQPIETPSVAQARASIAQAQEALVSAAAALPGSTDPDAEPRRRVDWSAPIALAGAASLGAGAVHAAAIGAHAEHTSVVKVFTVMAVLQLLWGALVLVRPARWLSAAGVALGGAAVVGWIMAKTSGISWVDGLQDAEPVQWSDGLCAALAAIAGIGAGVHLLVGSETRADGIQRGSTPSLRRLALGGAAAIAVLSLTGMNAAASHSHAGSDHHGSDEATGDGHGHIDDGETHAEGTHDDPVDGETVGAESSGAAHGEHGATAAVAPVPYDPELPIDLGGVEGVTPQQQARAENLVAITLARLPQFADYTTLEAKGYHSIQDGGTGAEHYINWNYINDGRELDPDYPESIVFDTTGPEKKLVSAMFFAEGGVDLDHVPDIGGKLTQWHIHNDLCFTESNPPRVAGLTDGAGNCGPGLRTLGNPVPMIHVWITPHKCGPFAALEGIGAGQVKAGDTKACDTAHGSSH